MDEDVIVDRGRIVLNEHYPSCYHQPILATIGEDYETTHSWSIGGSLALEAEVAVKGGLLSRVLLDGKVDLSVAVEVNGVLSDSTRKLHRREFQTTLLPCSCLHYRLYYDDYYAFAEQRYGTVPCCRGVITNPDGSATPYCYECWEPQSPMALM